MTNGTALGHQPDPNGDAVLVVGPMGQEQTHLHVSSNVLSLASPVFAALFSPTFAGGVRPLPCADPPEIPLPDDDRKAMKLICLVLHYHAVASWQVSLELLKKIATECDKYDLARALRGWSEACLYRWDLRATGYKELAGLLRCWVTFGAEVTFHDSSLALLSSSYSAMNYTETISEDREPGGLPWQFFVSIEAERVAINRILQTTIETVLDAARPEDGEATGSHIFRDFTNAKLWPTSKCLQDDNVNSVLIRLRSFKLKATAVLARATLALPMNLPSVEMGFRGRF
ncbi:MAG: hypothetical protein Q9163_004015 [Psora crenata]